MEERESMWQLLDSQIRNNLEAIKNLEPGSDERKKLVQETETLMKTQQEYIKIDNEAYDKSERLEVEKSKNDKANEVELKKLEMEKEDKKERRRIEEKKNKEAHEIEEKKLKVNWKDVGVKAGLCLIPLAIKIAVRNREQKMMYDFEEHGRLTSTAGRQYRPIDLNGKD